MRHLKKGRKFGRERNQRRALLKGLALSFFMKGKIETTTAKARELRPYVERCITRARDNTIVGRRHLGRFFPDAAVKKVMDHAKMVIAADRHGGYTRITKSRIRVRDGATMAILELVT